MSQDIKQIIEGIPNSVQVTSNIDLSMVSQIKKHIHDSHGASLTAVTMIDSLTEHQGLNIEITFNSESELSSFVDHLIGVWDRYEPIPTVIRSFNTDGKFIESFNGVQLIDNNQAPTNINDYKNKKVLIDVEKTGMNFVFKFYRWGEVYPRVLKLTSAV